MTYLYLNFLLYSLLYSLFLSTSQYFTTATTETMFNNDYELILSYPTTAVFKNYNKTFSINNIDYRESATYQLESSQFTVRLPVGKWSVTNPPFYTTIVPTFNSKLTDKNIIISKDQETTIDELLLQVTQPNSQLWISARSSALPFQSQGKTTDPYYSLLIDNRVIVKKQTPIFTVFLNIPIDIGIYNISIRASTGDNLWCSCPTIGNGFILSHDLWAWITVDHNKPLVNYNIKTPEPIMINVPMDDNIEQNDTKEVPFIIKGPPNRSFIGNFYLTSILSSLMLIDK